MIFEAFKNESLVTSCLFLNYFHKIFVNLVIVDCAKGTYLL